MASSRTDRLRGWWGRNVNETPVWRVSELPDRGFARELASLGLGHLFGRSVFALGKPGETADALVRARFWEVAAAVLRGYSPYALGGVSALRLWAEDRSIPRIVEVWTRSSSARIPIGGLSGLRLEKRPELFSGKGLRVVPLEASGRVEISVESAESLLAGMRPSWMRDEPDIVSAFLKAVRFDPVRVTRACAAAGKPAKLARLALMLRKLGRGPMARAVEEGILAASPGKRAIPRVSLSARLPADLAVPASPADPPYAVRFRDRFKLLARAAGDRLKPSEGRKLSLTAVLARAEKSRQYDAYHSTTIEGYRVTPEEIAALVRGERTPESASPEEIERRMALKGYLDAHAFVLERVRENFGRSTPLAESFIRDLYARLFSPAVEAGLLDAESLVRYRNHPVFLRGSRYVPPGDAKVPLLMDCLVEEANRIERPEVRAFLAHYGLVTVHPYRDGNGRLARLLMNYVLCSSGLPWITVRVDDRDAYFQALEAAQADGNLTPYLDLVEAIRGFPWPGHKA